jgi:hypothetical protein
MNTVGTFFGVLFVLLFAVAVTSNGALKEPDAFALRWTVVSLAVALSGLAAWLRWRAQPRRSVNPARAAIIPQVSGRMPSARRFDKVTLTADAY